MTYETIAGIFVLSTFVFIILFLVLLITLIDINGERNEKRTENRYMAGACFITYVISTLSGVSLFDTIKKKII